VLPCGSVRGHRVADALAELRLKGVTDIGAHLYESGRCAIAHANRRPIVDPDDPAGTRRLQSELPIMMALAQKAIEEELGVETSQTVYQKHLYELAGLKKILGPDTVAHLTRGEQITDQRMLSIPYVSVRIRKRPPYAPLSNLRVKEIAQTGKVFHIRFESKSGDVVIRFRLDFGAERLNFSIFQDLGVKDTGTPESAETIAEVRRFENEYFGNGQLHIVDADTGDLIARKDAYIPMNMYLDQDAADAEITYWKRTGEQRRDLNRRYAEESSRARTLTFSPASIRRKASSLNSRLNRLGSFVLNQSSPRKENCHHFPCLRLGVHSNSYRVTLNRLARDPKPVQQVVAAACALVLWYPNFWCNRG
jgi:hypothetical protein